MGAAKPPQLANWRTPILAPDAAKYTSRTATRRTLPHVCVSGSGAAKRFLFVAVSSAGIRANADAARQTRTGYLDRWNSHFSARTGEQNRPGTVARPVGLNYSSRSKGSRAGARLIGDHRI